MSTIKATLRIPTEDLTEGTMDVEDHEKMSKAQSWFFHQIDNANTRINRK